MKKARLPPYESTMVGLHKWYSAKLEKLGWMVLDKARGYEYKITTYKKSIQYLIDTIKNVQSEYQDPDRKHDLNILLMNTMALQEFVNKH